MSEARETPDEEKGDYQTRLKSALAALRGAKKPFACIVNLAKPVDFFWLTRGLVNPKQKEMLTALSGSKNFSKIGSVTRDGNMLVIEMQGAGKGMASRIQTALQKAAGLRMKVMIGTDVAEEADEVPAGEAKPSAALAAAPRVWRGTHELLAQRIELLKTSVRKHYGPNGAQVLAAIDQQLDQLDAVTARLDKSLADALDAVAKAAPAQRRDAVAKASRQAADYIAWVQKDTLVRHIDENPFGVPTRIQETVSKSLAEIGKGLMAA